MGDHETAAQNGNTMESRVIFPPAVMLYLLFGFVLFAILFIPAYSAMWASWKNEDFNHCFFVPLIVLYLLWEKRALLRTIPAESSWQGVVPLLFGVALFWIGELGGEFYTLYLASWFVFIGFYWLLYGWRLLKATAFPLLLLIAMFPLPNFITNNLTFRLKLISSQLGAAMLHWYGMSVYREGNVIDVGFTRLQVVDACSGLRFFFPLILLAVLLAYFCRAAWWKRVLLVILAVPLTVVMNALRIASVGVLYQFIGAQAAEGFFHDFSGWFIFMASLLVLLGFIWLMNRIAPEKGELGAGLFAGGGESRAPLPRPAQPGGFRWSFAMFIPVLALGATILAAEQVDFREKVPLRKPFSTFPAELGGWHGSRQTMEKIYLDELGLSDYLIVDYRDGAGKRVNFYTAYNESQRKGKSSHSPASCLPGNGWTFEKSEMVSIPFREGGEIEVNRALIRKNGERRLAYYWFPQRGRVLHGLLELKLYTFWDAMTKRRTDGALVRVITPIGNDESLRDAEGRLQGFVRLVVPVLNRYLPGKEA